MRSRPRRWRADGRPRRLSRPHPAESRTGPDAEGLAALQRAHRLAIPFENLAIRLGRGIAIDSASVFAKLVTAKRGGYCFEHNRLFADALAALGYAVRPLLARVWLTATEPPPLTHTLLLVSIGGTEWIADAGFGGSYCPPQPLADGAEAVAPDGARFRLRADAARGWMVERDGDPATTDGRGNGRPGFQPQFSFTTATVEQADLEMANHWTSTRPGTRFLDLAVVSIALPAGFASLTDRAYRRRTPSDDIAATIDDPRAYRLRLSMMFGIDLSAEEVAALGLF
jgi:N-hydroxyarylamine O-acetyltransferase